MTRTNPSLFFNLAGSFPCDILAFLRTVANFDTWGLIAAFPLFGIQMYEGLGYQWATGLLAFLTLAMLPFPYLFFKYGKRIRAKSRFATAS